MAEIDTFEFDASTMEKITKGIGEKSVDEILDECMLWDAESGDMLKAFDDILYPDTAKIITHQQDDSIDENVMREKEIFENFTYLLMDLEEGGEDLNPIILRSNVDKISLPLITPVASKLEKSLHHELPLGMRNSKDYEIKDQNKNSLFMSPLNKIYPRRVSQSSDVPSAGSLQQRNTLKACSHANSSNPTSLIAAVQQRVFNGIPNMASPPTVSKENLQKSVQPKANAKYQDLSKTTDEEAAKNCNYDNMRGRTREPFPVKLHSIIERSEEEEYSAVISWAPHGRAFKIHNEVLFVGKLLPTYFFQSKMSSFTRQLRMHGFQKIKSKFNVDKGAYFHELFLRGRPGLACGIIRLNSPCSAFRKNEPNLCNFSPMPCSKSCDQSEPSPSNDETAKEKNSINLRTIRYASSSSAENPTTTNASQFTIDINDEDLEEHLPSPVTQTEQCVDSGQESLIEDSPNLALKLRELGYIPRVKSIDESEQFIKLTLPKHENIISAVHGLNEIADNETIDYIKSFTTLSQQQQTVIS